MEKNHWSSWTRKTLSDPDADMRDWRYSDERMKMRQEVFRALATQLEQHCRHVYEFATIWVDQGNKDVENIVPAFENYLLSSLENSYAKDH